MTYLTLQNLSSLWDRWKAVPPGCHTVQLRTVSGISSTLHDNPKVPLAKGIFFLLHLSEDMCVVLVYCLYHIKPYSVSTKEDSVIATVVFLNMVSIIFSKKVKALPDILILSRLFKDRPSFTVKFQLFH